MGHKGAVVRPVIATENAGFPRFLHRPKNGDDVARPARSGGIGRTRRSTRKRAREIGKKKAGKAPPFSRSLIGPTGRHEGEQAFMQVIIAFASSWVGGFVHLAVV
jgi:hypothetical protein